MGGVFYLGRRVEVFIICIEYAYVVGVQSAVCTVLVGIIF